jgi:hypothetical protein
MRARWTTTGYVPNVPIVGNAITSATTADFGQCPPGLSSALGERTQARTDRARVEGRNMITRAWRREISNTAYRTFWATWLVLLFVAWVEGWHYPNPVTLSAGMAGYGVPACPTEDSTLPGGCRWVGTEATWVVYPSGND